MRQLKISKQITNRESQSLDKYLQEIGKVDLLTPDEEVDLAKRIRAGDQLALEKLTKANLRFVVSVAKQYQNQGLTLGDLINEAIWDSSRRPNALTKHADLSLSHTPYGGSASLFCKRWRSSRELFGCR